jgi:hypothetical protein
MEGGVDGGGTGWYSICSPCGDAELLSDLRAELTSINRYIRDATRSLRVSSKKLDTKLAKKKVAKKKLAKKKAVGEKAAKKKATRKATLISEKETTPKRKDLKKKEIDREKRGNSKSAKKAVKDQAGASAAKGGAARKKGRPAMSINERVRRGNALVEADLIKKMNALEQTGKVCTLQTLAVQGRIRVPSILRDGLSYTDPDVRKKVISKALTRLKKKGLVAFSKGPQGNCWSVVNMEIAEAD